jgi:hypothetical protein
MNETKGDSSMSNHQEPATKQYGNATVIIHSRLAHMTKGEQKAYFDDLKQKDDPRLKDIDKAIMECHMDS